MDESNALEGIAQNSLYAAGVNTDTVLYSFEIFKRHFRGTTMLEMGPAEGVMTEHLANTDFELSAVEGAELFCKDLEKRYPEMQVTHSLFEDFAPPKMYDNIVLGHVLEHVEEPVDILSRAREWLTEDGIILAAVPNARSLHRQAAVLMGLLTFEQEMNDADRHHGHRRVYTPETFRRDFLQAGLNIEVFGGYWMKPVSNKQIEETWTPEMLSAFMKLGERYPDISGEIYIVASRA
ncbi:Methyltransferase domain-containing protein [Roseovarius tolerans]|uniref:Methyltransferase domain-containing protein n=1 Tax=Roseovarius tolerans TaxID=74031 RepID=A0A1H8JBQ9_9RHOB|nr:class I SAM-dependent methyltransferase [Roseovarius tolerans]SEN77756.1 Methyltransferase domain-containing protein [Roseovarius tolerans]